MNEASLTVIATGGDNMKKPYETPTITTREVLSDITAQVAR